MYQPYPVGGKKMYSEVVELSHTLLHTVTSYDRMLMRTPLLKRFHIKFYEDLTDINILKYLFDAYMLSKSLLRSMVPIS